MARNAISALALVGTLQTGTGLTNTVELTNVVLGYLGKLGVSTEMVRLANLNLPAGIDETIDGTGKNDDWPALAKKIRAADIVIFATPIWWGEHSSLIQRVLERMTHFDESYIATNKSDLYHKVAGVVITGHEDGAQHIMGSLFSTLQWFGFVIPPESFAYWIGEVGGSMIEDPDKRRANVSTDRMARVMARNLANYATLITTHRDELEKFAETHPARVGSRGGTYVTPSD